MASVWGHQSLLSAKGHQGSSPAASTARSSPPHSWSQPSSRCQRMASTAWRMRASSPQCW